METFTYKNKSYKVDRRGFLANPGDWDEDFAEGMAPRVRIRRGLTEEHWRVIYFIRNSYEQMNECPLVYVACRKNDIGLGDLKRLFPSGYLRGACKLAGITYRDTTFQRYWLEENLPRHERSYRDKRYATDSHGFLLNHADWDENFAIRMAYKMSMPDYLTEKHWKVIYYLREEFNKTGTVPTVYETCTDNQIDLPELEELFPDGYHRGAVKIAGLCEK